MSVDKLLKMLYDMYVEKLLRKEVRSAPQTFDAAVIAAVAAVVAAAGYAVSKKR